MIRLIALSALATVLSPIAAADTLSWDFDHGWTDGHVITIDSEKKTIAINDREHKKVKSLKMINSKNVIDYLSRLIAKIADDETGQRADDGAVNKIVIVSDGVTTTKVIYGVGPPGTIAYNEGYAVEDELKKAEEFKACVDGFLVTDLLFKLQTKYFPESKEQ
ncbi:hypothetical protein [Luteolibacter sp. AS25]|uniref:hypothetical protein n=1 Tax=Luteolibacter sp. AS25 TaxID=3135776 RepID=UPI00398B87B3